MPSYPAFSTYSQGGVHYCRLGDVVAASGYIEPNNFTMRVIHIEVTEPWKATHAGTSFVPKLLPSLHANKQSCQADNGPPVMLLLCVLCQHTPKISTQTNNYAHVVANRLLIFPS